MKAQEILSKCGNDINLLGELCKLFVEESSKLMETLRTAVVNRDAGAIQRTAHTLRGSTQFFTTGPAVETLKQLEATARSGTLHDVDEAFSRLEHEMNQVREATARLPLELDSVPAAEVGKT